MNLEITNQEAFERNKKYILYRIAVECRSHKWFIFRRYNEFYVLYEKLRRKFQEAGLKLPGKKLFGNLDPKFVEHRKEGLHEFVQSIISNTDIFAEREVRDFLGINRNDLEDTLDFCDTSYQSESSDSFNLGSSENKRAKVSDYEFLKNIGKGSFGRVFLAKHRTEGNVYAVKVLSKEQIQKRDEVKHVMAERNVLVKNVKHPFLCTLHFSFQSSKKLYFVLDYVNGGELFFHLQREHHFPEPQAQFYAAEIACALGYLHSIDIIYRDLKPENILLDSEGHVILTDFGLSKEGIQANATTSTFCGTPEYLAPEVLRKEAYDRSVDWWCLGVVIYEMLFGLPPFYHQDSTQMYDKILHSPLKLKSSCTADAATIMRELLKKNPRQRLGSLHDFEEVRTHTFFSSIDWTALVEKQVTPPFRPQVDSPDDTRNIDKAFLQESLSESIDAAEEKRFSASVLDDNDDSFLGFSYVPPIVGSFSPP